MSALVELYAGSPRHAVPGRLDRAIDLFTASAFWRAAFGDLLVAP